MRFWLEFGAAWPVSIYNISLYGMTWFRRWLDRQGAATWLNKKLCIPALAGWVVLMATERPTGWWDWLFSLLFPAAWRYVHVKYHKDKHGRRLLEAARGWVQRRGNRLIVAPEAAS